MYKVEKIGDPQTGALLTFFPLSEVCGRWVNNFGAPEITIFRGVMLYRLVYRYADNTEFMCFITRNKQREITYFDLYGKICLAYDRQNDTLITPEGVYTRDNDNESYSTRKRIRKNN